MIRRRLAALLTGAVATAAIVFLYVLVLTRGQL